MIVCMTSSSSAFTHSSVIIDGWRMYKPAALSTTVLTYSKRCTLSGPNCFWPKSLGSASFFHIATNESTTNIFKMQWTPVFVRSEWRHVERTNAGCNISWEHGLLMIMSIDNNTNHCDIISSNAVGLWIENGDGVIDWQCTTSEAGYQLTIFSIDIWKPFQLTWEIEWKCCQSTTHEMINKLSIDSVINWQQEWKTISIDNRNNCVLVLDWRGVYHFAENWQGVCQLTMRTILLINNAPLQIRVSMPV